MSKIKVVGRAFPEEVKIKLGEMIDAHVEALGLWDKVILKNVAFTVVSPITLLLHLMPCITTAGKDRQSCCELAVATASKEMGSIPEDTPVLLVRACPSFLFANGSIQMQRDDVPDVLKNKVCDAWKAPANEDFTSNNIFDEIARGICMLSYDGTAEVLDEQNEKTNNNIIKAVIEADQFPEWRKASEVTKKSDN